MKALQVKRNSLRSLWRRGLVIFSIFGLVFALGACNRPVDPPPGNGNNGPGNGLPPPPARHVVDMTVLRGSQVMNFEGHVPNLTGLRVSLTWSDGTVTFTENPEYFTTIPPILTQADGANVMAGPGDLGINFNVGDPASATEDFSDYGSVILLVHRTNPLLSRPISLPWVRAFADMGGQAVELPMGRVDVTGRLTHQNRFEDDLIDFAGVTLETLHGSVNLVGFSFNADHDLVSESMQSLPSGLAEIHPAARATVALTHAHLDLRQDDRANRTTGNPHNLPSSNVGGIETIPPGDPTADIALTDQVPRGMLLRVSEVEIHLPITNWFPISHVVLESINPAGFPDLFQFWSGTLNWPSILFNDAGLRLRVHYNGTLETRVIGWEQFRRAEALGMAEVHPPVLTAPDVDEMIAQVRYWGVRPAGAMPPWQPDLHPWVNRTVDVQIPVLEFDGSVRFERRATEVNVPNIIWPHVDVYSWMPHPNLVEAIWRTYDLVAVYAGGRTLSINYIIGRQLPGGLFTHAYFHTFATGIGTVPLSPGAPNPSLRIFEPFISNGSTSPGEIEEAELGIRFPPITPLGSMADFWTGLSGLRGASLDWSHTYTRQAFAGLTADEEIQLQVLPRPRNDDTGVAWTHTPVPTWPVPGF